MSEQKSILTQDEIAALNEVLQNLGANLNLHVNASLSSAHGINARIGNYFDSAGDQWGNMVMVFEFGTPPNVTTIYVPAQVTNLGPARTTTGVDATATSATGSFLSPGVPLGKRALITEFTAQILEQASIYNNILLAHAATVQSDTGSSQAHGGTGFVLSSVLDSLNHTVGRYYVTIAINGGEYHIPGDVYSNSGSYGPPQLARGVNLLSNTTLKHNTVIMGNTDSKQYGYYWYTAATGGSTPFATTCSQPVAYQINSLADGTGTWASMTNCTGGFVNLAPTAKHVDYDISVPGVLRLRSHEGGTHKKLQCTIRCQTTNDAGTVTSNYCRFYAYKIEDDSCGFLSFIDPIAAWVFSGGSGSNPNSKTLYETITGSPAIQ